MKTSKGKISDYSAINHEGKQWHVISVLKMAAMCHSRTDR